MSFEAGCVTRFYCDAALGVKQWIPPDILRAIHRA